MSFTLPHYLSKLGYPGATNFQPMIRRVWNRTGGATTANRLYMFDTQKRGGNEVLAFTGGGWTDATKVMAATLTGYSYAAGDRLVLTGGTGVITGSYALSAGSATDVTVVQDINGASGNIADASITGYILRPATYESAVNSKGLLLPTVTNYNWDESDPASAFSNIVVYDASAGRSAMTCVALDSVGNREQLDVLIMGPAKLQLGYSSTGGSQTFTAWSRVLPVTRQITVDISNGSSVSIRPAVLSAAVTVGTVTGVVLDTPLSIDTYFNGFGGSF